MQLAVDSKVEQREIANATINGQLRSDFPDMLGLQRGFLTDNAAGVPGFRRLWTLFDIKYSDLLQRTPHPFKL
jgi:hypothetical protein